MIKVGHAAEKHDDAPPRVAESGEGREAAENRRGGEVKDSGLELGAPPNDNSDSRNEMRLP